MFCNAWKPSRGLIMLFEQFMMVKKTCMPQLFKELPHHLDGQGRDCLGLWGDTNFDKTPGMPEAKCCPKLLEDTGQRSQAAAPWIHSVQEGEFESELFSCLGFSPDHHYKGGRRCDAAKSLLHRAFLTMYH